MKARAFVVFMIASFVIMLLLRAAGGNEFLGFVGTYLGIVGIGLGVYFAADQKTAQELVGGVMDAMASRPLDVVTTDNPVKRFVCQTLTYDLPLLIVGTALMARSIGFLFVFAVADFEKAGYVSFPKGDDGWVLVVGQMIGYVLITGILSVTSLYGLSRGYSLRKVSFKTIYWSLVLGGVLATVFVAMLNGSFDLDGLAVYAKANHWPFATSKLFLAAASFATGALYWLFWAAYIQFCQWLAAFVRGMFGGMKPGGSAGKGTSNVLPPVVPPAPVQVPIAPPAVVQPTVVQTAIAQPVVAPPVVAKRA